VKKDVGIRLYSSSPPSAAFLSNTTGAVNSFYEYLMRFKTAGNSRNGVLKKLTACEAALRRKQAQGNTRQDRAVPRLCPALPRPSWRMAWRQAGHCIPSYLTNRVRATASVDARLAMSFRMTICIAA